MNIKEKIQTIEKLNSEVEDIEEELGKYITSRLKYLYKLQEEYRKTNPNFRPLVGWEDIDLTSDFINVSGDDLIIYYINSYTYYSGEIMIPIDALEDNSSIEKWFRIKTSEYEDKLEKAKKEKEEKEYNEYLKLKNKYENKNTI